MQIQNTITMSPHKQNLTKHEKSAMAELKSNPDIVIKPADKGSAVVIMNRNDYIHEGIRQLSDTNFYQKLDKDISNIHIENIHSQLNQMLNNGEISTKCHKYLTGTKYRTARFYMLPKIHKGLTPPPGRPIISGNNSPTERISQFVDHFIKDIAKTGKSYIKDTEHFLHIINNMNDLPPGTILATLDIVSLYTNIPNEEGIKATMKALNTHRPNGQNPTNISIVRLLRMVLTMNNFEFNGDHYLQIGGTAMGTKLAPNYAIITVNNFEDLHVYTYEKQPLLWARYIDDIFIVWQHGKDELKKFIEHLNVSHRSFKFTCESSTEQVNFLDTTVILNPNGTLHTTLYTKPTDAHMYLHYDSSHPKHCKTSLPYSQFLRIRRICSKDEDFEYNARKHIRHFLNRGYPPQLLQKAYNKAKNYSKEDKTNQTLLPNNNARGNTCNNLLLPPSIQLLQVSKKPSNKTGTSSPKTKQLDISTKKI